MYKWRWKTEEKIWILKKANGITLVALIITIIVLVILAAVTITSMYNNKIIETTQEGAIDYEYEQEKEKISDALYVAILQSFIEESISIDYSKVPENVAKILNDGGQFECQLVNADDNGYSVYNITPTGKNFYFVLRMSNANGQYELELGE